jgi:glycosidase
MKTIDVKNSTLNVTTRDSSREKPQTSLRSVPAQETDPARKPTQNVIPKSQQTTQAPLYPSLYQINTRVWVTGLTKQLGRPATLDDVPDAELDRIAKLGFDWVWLLSVWQTGAAAQAVSRSNPEWRHEFEQTLPDLTEDDIPGSGFAITGYTVHRNLGGDAALARLRKRLRKHGLRLMLDFVPNHMAPDHPWVAEHPEYFVGGSDADLAGAPQNYFRAETADGPRVFAYGRDPYFAGWPDTIQLNYGDPALQEAMIGELTLIAGQCDGVRCDMAMLVLPDVFERTWGRKAPLFWPEATRRVRERTPGFCFMAEVYWGREWDIQQQGFDYAYDKTLYDRLREGHARPVREHFHAGLDYQNKLARFLENHDEPRAAATFSKEQHEAAAVITFLSPGIRFFHQGQFEGRLKRISPHLGRAPGEEVNSPLKQFYERLLDVLRRPAVRQGQWQLLECVPAWDGNGSSDAFIAFSWQDSEGARLLVAVNYASHSSQCYVRLPFRDLADRQWRLRDLMGEAQYERDGNELQSRGLYLDLPPWQYHVFEINAD